MSGEILKSKNIEVKMILDGVEFKRSFTIPETTAELQWIRCQSIGDCMANTIMHNTDIKEQFKRQVANAN